MDLQNLNSIHIGIRSYANNLFINKSKEWENWDVSLSNVKNENAFFMVTTLEEKFFIQVTARFCTLISCSCQEHNCEHIRFLIDSIKENEDIIFDFKDNINSKNELNSFLEDKILSYNPPIKYIDNFLEKKVSKNIISKSKEFCIFGKDYFIFLKECNKKPIFFAFAVDYNSQNNFDLITQYSQNLIDPEISIFSKYINRIIIFKLYNNICNFNGFADLAESIKNELLLKANISTKMDEDFVINPSFEVTQKNIEIKENASATFEDNLFEITDKPKPTIRASIGYNYVELFDGTPYFEPFLSKVLKNDRFSNSHLKVSKKNIDNHKIDNISPRQKEYLINVENASHIGYSRCFSETSFSIVTSEIEKIGRDRIFIKDKFFGNTNLNIIDGKKIKISLNFVDDSGKNMGALFHYQKDENNWKTIIKDKNLNCYKSNIKSCSFLESDYGKYSLIYFDKENISLQQLFAIMPQLSKFESKEISTVIDTLEKLEKYGDGFITFDKNIPQLSSITIKPEAIITIIDSKISKDLRIDLNFDNKKIVEQAIKLNKATANSVVINDEKYMAQVCQFLNKDEALFPIKPVGNNVYCSFKIIKDDFETWLKNSGYDLLKKGFSIYFQKDKRKIDKASTLSINYKNDIKWFEYSVELKDFNGNLYQIENFDFKTQTATSNDGTIHILDEKDFSKIAKLIKYAQKTNDGYKVPASNFVLINELYDNRETDNQILKESIEKVKKLSCFNSRNNYSAPKNFKTSLRNYQLAGYQWLRFLNEYGFSGCLADDMGLGKTVQTLSLLQHLKNTNKLEKILLIVPVSAIVNWENEIDKFTTKITYYRHIGSLRDEQLENKNIDIIISSYATVRNDIELLKNIEFNYVILDESQNIKNYNSQTSKAVKLLKAKNRLALSGTPIENNIMELWSLFDFLLPEYLGTSHWFKLQYSSLNDGSVGNSEVLKKMIFPFMLRRKKEDVEIELPPKNEVVVSVEMDKKQQDIYSQIAKKYREMVSKELRKKDREESSSMKVLEGMLRLRQVCLFPDILDEQFNEIPSAKFDEASKMLIDVIEEGHKVLFFSQFVEVLARIEKYLISNKINYSYIDGSTTLKKREKMINNFQQNSDNKVFLLSIKAGGVALNLTQADYVFIYDPWWNPAIENQAIDRAHRLGQKKSVFVYRFIVKNSIEEKILKLQNTKKALTENIIISDVSVFKKLSKDDILGLFD